MIEIKPDRNAAIEAGFFALQAVLNETGARMDFPDFKKALAAWDIEGAFDGPRCIGMLMSKGPEIHVAVIPEYRRRWASRRLIRSVILPRLKKYGKVSTWARPDNDMEEEFITRIGFKKYRDNYEIREKI